MKPGIKFRVTSRKVVGDSGLTISVTEGGGVRTLPPRSGTERGRAEAEGGGRLRASSNICVMQRKQLDPATCRACWGARSGKGRCYRGSG
jgi:hypothetical protein